MSKKILETLANSLQDMHDNHEPLSWALLASAIDIAIRTAPEGVQDMTDDKIAELVSENLRLNEALETNCQELNKLRSEITKAESQTITMFHNFGILEASMGLQNNLHALSLRHQTVVANGKFVLDEVKKERDTLKEQVVELAKSERAVVDFQNQLMNLFPEISKDEDYDTLNTLQKVYEQAMSLQVKVAELGVELKAYKYPWLSAGDKVVFNFDIQSDDKLYLYASKGEEAEVLSYDPARKRAALKTRRGSTIFAEQHLFDKKA